jgi:hypothetical protein
MAELAPDVLARVSTADHVDSRLGPLEFVDGAPSRKTVETLYDHLDFYHGMNAFLKAFPAASTHAIREGFHGVGVRDNDVLIFSELMDSSSRFLTANADTVYYIAFVDLANGPMVVETPPMALGTFDDMWFKWICDFGMPGPDRGAGGKFVLVPPGYDGALPEGGFFIGHSRTHRVLILGRSFMQDSDPAPTVATIKSTLKIYPYAPGGPGTSIGTLLKGEIHAPAPGDAAPETRFVEGTGLTFNTIPPNDAGFFQTVHALLQDEPAEAGDPETTGHLAELGIRKGKPFAPDERMRRILDEAAVVGNATARALMFDSRGEEDVAEGREDDEDKDEGGSGHAPQMIRCGRKAPPDFRQGISPDSSCGPRSTDLRWRLISAFLEKMSGKLGGQSCEFHAKRYIAAYSPNVKR